MRSIATPECGQYIIRENHEETDSSDKRSQFQHDRDRIIHSSALKSLQYKTQVYMFHEGDLYRTRLTHTLEVAQISRSLAIQLGANVDLAEAIALVHDLGHTPFGHAGESTINGLLKKPWRIRFNHNIQGYKIVTCLEERYPDFQGLNLTFATLEGLLRHSTIFDKQEDIKKSIPSSIKKDVKKFWKTDQPGIEAQMVNMADIIGYASHDIEDALSVGLISWREFKEEVNAEKVGFLENLIGELEQTMQNYTQNNPNASRAVVERLTSRQLSRRIINRLILATCENTNANIETRGIETRAQPWEGVRHCKQEVVALPKQLQGEVQSLVEEILMHRVYRNYHVVLMQEKAKLIMKQLFETFMREPGALPEMIQHRLQQDRGRSTDKRRQERKRAEVVADYIAGMTDKHAMDVYQLLVEAYEKAL